MKKQLAYFGIILFAGTCLIFNTAQATLHARTHKASYGSHGSLTDDVCPDNILSFAQSLIGTRYRSASSNPLYGFDCSGFVSYVFKNFDFDVPRSSCEFINAGEKVSLADAKSGDVILFTGTSKKSRRIGHVAIVVTNQNNELTFIHSTSGKEHGVTITTMDKRYKRRFVQVIRLLKQNNEDYTS